MTNKKKNVLNANIFVNVFKQISILPAILILCHFCFYFFFIYKITHKSKIGNKQTKISFDQKKIRCSQKCITNILTLNITPKNGQKNI